MRWAASASEILNEEASEESGQSTDSFRWMGFWAASASEILSEKASEDTVLNSVFWPGDFYEWETSASEILKEEALEESGQSTDDF
ncbi:hypothetical protein L210DRAFT_3653595 [Boletus edulis BED1]|uniref:Uncharacterized protein n=1 Tax=Boletus edulis BED1 TaxID=1328754 RepID=A0AAD4G881_BOLED|nr:hypothetical protein L210DRAFT_3653595 [Boletus edulis BED1]